MKAIKWALIVCGVLIVLVIAALIIVPQFVDIQKYKPQLERKVTEATGRPFTLGGDFDLSLFPWAGISFSDLHLGNPEGFEEKDFVSIESFEVRVKLLPLITRDIQVKRFMVEGARIVLETGKDGRTSWEGLGPPPAEAKEGVKEKKAEGEKAGGLPIKDFILGELAITKGSVLWLDHTKGERREITDLTIRLEDVSLDKPITLFVSSLVDKNPVSLEGTIGPVGKDPGKGIIPLDLKAQALEEIALALSGIITSPAEKPQFDLTIAVSPFSPKKLMERLDLPFPVKTKDPKVIEKVSFKAGMKGTPDAVSVSKGTLVLDDSTLNFSAGIKELDKPNITFDLALDGIDLDRYLPPPENGGDKKEAEAKPSGREKTDYTPLRKLVLDGAATIGNLKISNARIQNLSIKCTGRNGVFTLEPATLDLYGGSAAIKGLLNVKEDTPKTNVDITTDGIQVNPFLRDVMDKDFLEGTVKADLALQMSGDNAEVIKKSLSGGGELLFNDGAIKGIDLAGMVRNAKAAFGLAETGGEKPRTDFSELRVPFTAAKGVVSTQETKLTSPLIRVTAKGDADIPKETLDFRIEPKFVTTLKGQGDMADRSGITVPVLVTGTFSSPKFAPDLKSLLKQGLEGKLPKPEDIKETLQKSLEGETKSLEEGAKDLMKGLFKSQ
ncbi:MAG: AsmA family protein [Deltaproteobacteria bacterium]|nr:AsmA family protein [Deltaproteobacteria bacterium]MBN2846691.1 AsmA family protein [Deltaproteobacteria bacterium]